jgi:hypothetical protein
MRFGVLLLISGALSQAASPPVIRIDTPKPPPYWALAERALFKSYAEAAAEFAAKYVDDRGFFRCLERWGGNDGPDDVMETFTSWTLLYALGGTDPLLELYRKIWEGHLVQFTQARAPSTQMAKTGMYYREFPASFDWEHNGEGLAAFHFYALAAPHDPRYIERVRRFAGFYLNEDREAPNYDPKLKIIRSLHNGSRGPLLTAATVFDWGGETVLGHPERHDRYKDASNIRGDHPLNLLACTLAFNAYALTGDRKYRDWLLEYAGAWRDRVLANGGNIPTNIGLDGTIGGEWGGKWYGGTFGWNFDPSTSGRNYYMRGGRTGFGEAFLLTGDAAFVEPLRRQLANLYAARQEQNGRILLPQKFGEKGWYSFTENQYFELQRDIYLWLMDPAGRQWLGSDPWLRFLDGKDPDYPARTLEADLERIRRRLQAMRQDLTTADRRPSDGAQPFNPVSTETLVNLTLGTNDPGKDGNILHSRVRYFDPVVRRPGLPEDVAALVERVRPADLVLTLINTSPVHSRSVVVQAGAFAENQWLSVELDGRKAAIDSNWFTVSLAPGCGGTLTLADRRYVNQPAAAFPWRR